MSWLKRFIAIAIVLTTHNGYSNHVIGFQTDSTIQRGKVGVNLISGVLMYHHKEMMVLLEKPVNAIELSWILVGTGNNLWHREYHYPEYGLSYVLLDLGSPSILGYSHGLQPFINFPISPFNRRLSAGFRVGSGLTYITKTYHRTDNFKNSAISTHINALISFNLEGRYALTNSLTLRAGFQLTHISNGTYKKPNSSLNYTTASCGLTYCYSHQNISNRLFHSFTDKPNRIQVFGYGSIKEVKGAGGPKYRVAALSAEYSRPITTLWRYGVALDVMYDESSAFIMEYKEIPYDTKWQTVSSGATFNTEISLDRLSAVAHFGTYFKNPSREGGAVYQRVGLRYRLNNYVWMHLALKTHWGSADYIEYGLGYKIY